MLPCRCTDIQTADAAGSRSTLGYSSSTMLLLLLFDQVKFLPPDTMLKRLTMDSYEFSYMVAQQL